LFELEMSARKASIQLGLSYPTTLKGFDILRGVILRDLSRSDEVLRGEIEADESYFGGKRKGKRGRGAGGKTIVFGILERGGRVSVKIVKDVSSETLIQETVTKVRRESIVYTDKWKGYDSLMFCGYRHLNIDHGCKFKQGKVCINGVEGFWSFAKERLIKHHGISKNKFLLYIKEMEWRYNNRDKNLFELLIKYMLGADDL
jgi:transposase